MTLHPGDMPLTHHHLAARSGRTNSLVVLLHGFGSSGATMFGLARTLSIQLPDTDFLVPDAPHPVPGRQSGRMWFTIPELFGSTAEEADRLLQAAAARLDALLDRYLVKIGLPASAAAMLGFSQGAAMCYEVGPRRQEALAGVVTIAGRLKRPDALVTEVRSTPPFLILTGANDSLMTAADLATTAAALDRVGIPATYTVMPDTGHGLSEEGIHAAGTFLHARLHANRQPTRMQ